MLNIAVIENNVVSNVIYISQEVMEDFVSSGMELIDVRSLGLRIGDYRRDGLWYRMIDGIEFTLPLEVEPDPTEAEDMQAALEALGVEPEEGAANG